MQGGHPIDLGRVDVRAGVEELADERRVALFRCVGERRFLSRDGRASQAEH
jgi:hypothetical protein